MLKEQHRLIVGFLSGIEGTLFRIRDKPLAMKRVLVTGGAGFIGSSLVDALMNEGHQVTVVDDLTSGKRDILNRWVKDPMFAFEEQDLLTHVEPSLMKDCDIVYHLAANPDVRVGTASPKTHFDQNIQVTYNLLEQMRKRGAKTFVFTSSSTVYGEPIQIPTREDYGPLKPVSVYGASKLACESLISAYANTYGFKASIFRLANIVGPRSTHGVVNDLVHKLLNNREQLSMFGDGTQDKSYLHITDCIRALLGGIWMSTSRSEIFNLGSEDKTTVTRIADAVCQEMGLSNVSYHFHSDCPDGKGWTGDVKTMQLDISKIKRAGWTPLMNSEQSVRRTVKELVGEQPLVYAPRAR